VDVRRPAYRLTYNSPPDANWGELAMAEVSKLGRYDLRRVLGKGAMGVVYEGFDPTLSRRVAVKTILKSVALDSDTERAYSARFVLEAKAVARLNHPNIVQVHDFGLEGEVAYLVMEFIQGRELRSFFEAKEMFNAAETVRLMGELLDALDFAHEAGVIHRDVKPANVMLDLQQRVKLTDFGVARLQESEHSTAGTMVGTPAFMSPEQIKGGKIDRRTDIFSAGVVLYQLLTGEQPFKGAGAWTVAKKIVEDDPPPPSSVVLTVWPAFDAVVHKALAKKPNERFASAKEFSTALREALTTVPQRAVSVGTNQKAKTETKATETELEFWRSIQNRDDLDELELYVEQFPNGAYTQLARLKIAKLEEPAEAARKAAEEQAREESEAKEKARQGTEARARAEADARARQEAEALARRQTEEKAKREAETKARREAEEKALREALEKTKREATEKATRDAAAKAKREADDKARREREAQALARLKQQEEAAARAKVAVDEDATVEIGGGGPAMPPEQPFGKKTSLAVPAIAAAVVIVAGMAAYAFLGRTPAPVPVAEISPSQKAAIPPPAPVVDVEKVRRETEERVRKEFAEKAAVERAAMEKAVAEKAAAEKVAAEKLATAKTAAERATAEKAAEKATAERVAAEKAAAEKAEAERLAAETATAERVATEKAAAERTKALALKKEEDERRKVELAAKKEADAKAQAAQLAAAPPAAQKVGAQSWEYQSYRSGGFRSAPGYITVEDKGGKTILRMVAGTLINCYNGDLDATVIKTEATTIITVVPLLRGCEEIRFVIKNDGTGGQRQIKKGSGWVWDGLDRVLTPIK
jgi:serine/threonine-protein kinase